MGLLNGKVAIVTGAAHGIGRGHAMELAAQGASVIVNDLGGSVDGEGSSRAADLTVDLIRGRGGTAIANYEDVADFEGAGRMVAHAVEAYGKLDILVNNAGILRDGMSFNLSEEDWDSVIRVHLKGHFAPSRFAAVYWREQSKKGEPVSGRIINTSSESGLFGNAGQSNYAAAKAGIASMTIVLARELQKYGVTVNAMAPRARTRLTETVAGAEQLMAAKEGEFDAWDPDNMAPLIGFLASDAAADVSGQVFVMWGDRVYLMRGWSLANELAAGGKRWTVEDLISHKAELFAPAEGGSAIPSMAFSM